MTGLWAFAFGFVLGFLACLPAYTKALKNMIVKKYDLTVVEGQARLVERASDGHATDQI